MALLRLSQVLPGTPTPSACEAQSQKEEEKNPVVLISILFSTKPCKLPLLVVATRVTLTMTNNQATPNSRIARAIGMRLFLVFCIAVYPLVGAATRHSVITHDHVETHGEMQHDHHPVSDGSDDHHENPHDNNSGDEGEHHHHFACHGSVALATVDPANYSLFHRVMKHGLLSHNEIHPKGPTFEIVKPPQVA